MHRKGIVVALLLAGASPAGAAGKGRPSRPAEKGCAWEKLSDPRIGLEAWVQRCDFGFRKIQFRYSKNALAIAYSDGGGELDPLVDVFDLRAGESPEAGARRIFAERTGRELAGRCILAPYKDELNPTPAGVERYTFVPDAAYDRELEARGPADGVPDPPCGDWGEAPDGIQYWEAQPSSGARRILFVRVGQDVPLFDEQTLTILPPK